MHEKISLLTVCVFFCCGKHARKSDRSSHIYSLQLMKCCSPLSFAVLSECYVVIAALDLPASFQPSHRMRYACCLGFPPLTPVASFLVVVRF